MPRTIGAGRDDRNESRRLAVGDPRRWTGPRESRPIRPACSGSTSIAAVAARLASWAVTDMRPHVERVLQRWRSHLKSLENQRERLREREKPLAALERPTDEDTETLGRIVAELRYVAGRIVRTRSQDTLGALEALGLLPNYTLFDDTVTLEVSLWRTNAGSRPRKTNSQGASPRRHRTTPARPRSPLANSPRATTSTSTPTESASMPIDVGTEHEPAHATWRFCPICAWASTEAAAVRRMPALWNRRRERSGVAAHSPADARRVLDRTRDISTCQRRHRGPGPGIARSHHHHRHRPGRHHSSAYLHTNTVFGVESARAARIRYLNLGLHASRGGLTRQVRINGYDTPTSLFRVCRHCGGVFGIRGDARNDQDPNHHRSWCKVRSGARNEQWDHLALVHELVTEAVRILLPVAEFEAQERVLIVQGCAAARAARLLRWRPVAPARPPDRLPRSRTGPRYTQTGSSSCTTPSQAARATCRDSRTPSGFGRS